MFRVRIALASGYCRQTRLPYGLYMTPKCQQIARTGAMQAMIGTFTKETILHPFIHTDCDACRDIQHILAAIQEIRDEALKAQTK